MDLSAGCRVNDFHKFRIVFCGVIHVHDPLGAFGPLHCERLPAPQGTGPESGIVGTRSAHDLARFDRPCDAQILIFNRSGPVGADVPKIVAAECDDSFHLRIFIAGPEYDRLRPLIGSDLRSVHFDSGYISPVFRPCRVHRMRYVELRRRCGGRCRLRRRRRSRRGCDEQRRNRALRLSRFFRLFCPAEKQEQNRCENQKKQRNQDVERRFRASSSPALPSVFPSAGRSGCPRACGSPSAG